MPKFPNGSRISVCEFNGAALKEYGETVEKADPDAPERTHTMSVYIPASKGQEFCVKFLLQVEGHPYARLTVHVDRQQACSYKIGPTEFGIEYSCKGFQTTSTSLQRFAFGDIETDESDETAETDQKQQLQDSCIEVSWSDAYVVARRAAAPHAVAGPQSRAVHPDSKAASLVGVQVKTGQTEYTAPVMSSVEVLDRAPGSTLYVCRFYYRPAKLLIAQGLMPDEDVPADKRKASEEVASGSDDAGGVEAGPSKKKSKTGASAAKKEPKPDVKQEGGSSSNAIDIDAAPKNQKLSIDLTGGSDEE